MWAQRQHKAMDICRKKSWADANKIEKSKNTVLGQDDLKLDTNTSIEALAKKFNHY